MIREDVEALQRLYAAFNGIRFNECGQCSACCYLPWLQEEEHAMLLQRFEVDAVTINSVSFIANPIRCNFVTLPCGGCSIYPDRPLDCRMFPLDIIEERRKYYWCVFTTCPKYRVMRAKLAPLLLCVEGLITAGMWQQYTRQIALTKRYYPPYRDRRYEIVQEFRGRALTSHDVACC